MVEKLDNNLQIRGNSLVDGLIKADFDSLRPFFSWVQLEHNEVICRPGSIVDHVFFPTQSVLSVITLMEDGQGVEACTIGHESAHGLLHALGSSIALDRVIAQVPGQCLKLSSAKLKVAAAASPHLTDLIIRHVQVNTAQTQQSVACNALHHVEARLCRWLLMSQDRMINGKLPLTQEFLGYMLGVQRTTVTGAARSLQSAGLIRYARGQIEILDRNGLEEGACECYAVVRNKHAQIFTEG
jgi:CRP-like cAMP-binding protein